MAPEAGQTRQRSSSAAAAANFSQVSSPAKLPSPGKLRSQLGEHGLRRLRGAQIQKIPDMSTWGGWTYLVQIGTDWYSTSTVLNLC